MNDNLETYERIQTEGLNQKQLIVMMYAGITRFLKEAKQAISDKDFQTAHEKFDRSRKIVFHLMSTLNPEAGDIAEKLNALYVFLIEKITEANLKKDGSIVDEIVPIIDNIREGWESIKLDDKSIPDDKKKMSGKPAQQVSITI